VGRGIDPESCDYAQNTGISFFFLRVHRYLLSPGFRCFGYLLTCWSMSEQNWLKACTWSSYPIASDVAAYSTGYIFTGGKTMNRRWRLPMARCYCCWYISNRRQCSSATRWATCQEAQSQSARARMDQHVCICESGDACVMEWYKRERWERRGYFCICNNSFLLSQEVDLFSAQFLCSASRSSNPCPCYPVVLTQGRWLFSTQVSVFFL